MPQKVGQEKIIICLELKYFFKRKKSLSIENGFRLIIPQNIIGLILINSLTHMRGSKNEETS